MPKMRGFAAMTPERQREIATLGGKAAHAKATARHWTQDEARAAGSKGGTISRGGRGRKLRLDVGVALVPMPDLLP